MAISLRGLWQAFMAHRHTAAEVGAAPVNHSHSLESLGAAPVNHTHPSMNRTATDVLFSGRLSPVTERGRISAQLTRTCILR